MEIRLMTPSQRRTAASPQEEECLAMLGGMTIYRKETPGKKVRSMPVETEMERLQLVEEKIRSTIIAERKKEADEPWSTKG